MKVTIDINNEAGAPISGIFIRGAVKKTIQKVGLVFPKNKKINISLAFLDAVKIKKINKAYRRKNVSTDILSFANYPSEKEILKDKKNCIFLGELLISYEYVRKSAKVNKVAARKELAYVVSHGVLHLLGMRHSRRMFVLQDEVARGIYN